MSEEKEPIPAGWYQAPGESTLDRYWDGTAWTAESRPRPRAGLQPAPPTLVVHDGGRHPLPWVFTALGLGLIVAAILTWQSPSHFPAALLGAVGCLVLSPSAGLLQADLAPRKFAVVRLVLGAAILAVSVAAAVTITALAWFTASGALFLVAWSLRELRRAKGGSAA